jgi:hypothetical protein
VELWGLGLTWWRNNDTPSDLVYSDQAATLQGTQILGCSIYFIQAIVGVSELEFLLPVLVSVIVIVGVVSVSESSVCQFVICEELHFGPSIVTIWSADEIVNGE